MVTNNPESNADKFAVLKPGMPGNPGGIGKQVKKDVRDLRQRQFDLKAAVVASIKPEQLFDIAQKIIELAQAGNIDAATWIWDRCIGKPIPEPEQVGDSSPAEPAKVVLLDWRRNGAPAESN